MGGSSSHRPQGRLTQIRQKELENRKEKKSQIIKETFNTSHFPKIKKETFDKSHLQMLSKRLLQAKAKANVIGSDSYPFNDH